MTPTPDDGIRRGTAQVWDESTRPSAPPPPPMTYTESQRAAGQHLVDVHDHFRGELATILDLVQQVGAGGRDPGGVRSAIHAMTLRQNNWTVGAYCASYCRLLTTHHTLEDVSLFPQLRAADPELAPVLDRLAAEHHAIHEVLDRVDRALVALVSAPDGLAELQAAVDLLSDALLSHLSYEERELVEPLARFAAL